MLTFRLVLKGETETCMRLLGVERVIDLGPKHVRCLLLFSMAKLTFIRSIRVLSSAIYMMAMQG